MLNNGVPFNSGEASLSGISFCNLPFEIKLLPAILFQKIREPSQAVWGMGKLTQSLPNHFWSQKIHQFKDLPLCLRLRKESSCEGVF